MTPRKGDVDCKLDSVEARQVLGQHLDAPFVCSSDIHVHIAQIRVELDASPCLSANSRKHLLGGCGPLAYPPWCACTLLGGAPQGSRGSRQPLHTALMMGNGRANCSNNITRNKCGGIVNSGAVGHVGKRNAGIAARVGPQMGAARSRAVGQHSCLPER